jgi:hypothetical protein
VTSHFAFICVREKAVFRRCTRENRDRSGFACIWPIYLPTIQIPGGLPMKCTCPACGKKTAIEADVGDFPSRCQRCGALLRAPGTTPSASGLPRGLPVRSRSAVRPMRIKRGALAGLLISNSGPREEDLPTRVIHGSTYTAGGVAEIPDTERPPSGRLLRPESLREIARASARQKALRRATLRGNHQALGLLGKMGFLLVAMLTVGALVLEARLMLNPATSRADVVLTSQDAAGR